MWPFYLVGGKDEANNMATHIIGGSKLCTKNSLQSMSISHLNSRSACPCVSIVS